MTLNRRMFSKALAAAAPGLGLATAACGSDQLTVLLDWFVNPNHGPLIVAKEIGAFKRAGLNVNFVQPADPTMPPRLVAAGHGDIAVNYQPALYLQVTNGLPLVRIGALVDRPMVTFTTLEGYGITKPADLKGKRFGYNDVSGPVGLIEADCLLAAGGLARSDVQLVNVGTALSTSLLSHRVDIIGLERNFETLELIEHGAKPIGFDAEQYGVPEFDNLIMVANKAKASDPRIHRFIAAVKEGATHLKAQPDEAWKLFLHAYPTLDNPLNRNAWKVTVPYFAANPAEFDAAKYARFGQFLLAKGVIRTLPPPSDYAVQM
jgi:putative hydroxymethylpyrimidine transport system substrate-binding protein